MNIKVLLIASGLLCAAVLGAGQDVLMADEAVRLAIENHFDIRRAENASEIAANNASKYNTAQLPTIGLEGSAALNINNSHVTFQDGSTTNLSWIQTQNAGVSLAASYTIFNGFFRKYNIEQLAQRYLLSQLDIEAAMENLAAQTLNQYYAIAALENTLIVLEEAIAVSRQRLLRAETQVEYGQGSELLVLNARVDLNNDSLNYQNARMQLDIAKRNLNRLMVTGDETDYTVSPALVFYETLDAGALRKNTVDQNIRLRQMDKNIEIGRLSINLAKARKLPALSTNVSYGFNYGRNGPASFLASQNSNGLRAGLTLSWNIFDGGATRVAEQNARLNAVDLEVQKAQLLYELETDFDIAWTNYRNSLLIFETNQKNETISRQNFERSEAQFRIGQITSVDFRQAQLNLLQAQSNLIGAQLDVKTSEIQLLLLSGNILD